MKTGFLLLFALPFWCAAQSFVLLDRNLELPVQLHTGFDLSDAASGAFPLHVQDVDAVVHCLDTLARTINAGNATPPLIEKPISEHCSILLWHQSSGWQDTFTGVLRVSNGNMVLPLTLVKNHNRKHTVRRLKQLADYIRNNRTVVKDSMKQQ
jgi:hypothetical protein